MNADGRAEPGAAGSTVGTSGEWDSTEAQLRDSVRRLSLLANTSATMLLREEPRDIIEGVFGLLRDELQLACCFNYLVEDDGVRLRLNAALGIDPSRFPELQTLEFGQAVCGNVALQRTEIVRHDIQEATDQMAEVVRSMGITAYACIPLIAGTRLVGTFSVGKRGRTRFMPDEMDLLRRICAQLSVALDRRRLIRVSRALRMRADRLQSLTAALSQAATPTQVAGAVITHATAAFDAMGTVITRVTGDGGGLEILDARAMPGDILENWKRFPLDAEVPLAEVVRRGEPVAIESREEWERRYPSLAGMLEQTGQHSLLVMPLVVEGEAIGSMGIAFDRPRVFSSDDRTLASVVAQQCAQALERARLFEAEQEARAAAETANLEKVDLLASVSHDLRTPLNAIGGYVQILEMGLRGPVTSAQQQDLSRILTNQRRLLHLVEELLRFASLSSGERHAERLAISVNEALTLAYDSIAPQAAAKSLRIEVQRAPETLAILGDTERVQKILVNVVGNAVKYTPRGGAITLSAEVPASQPGVVHLRVSDTGPGIPADQQRTIFEPFRQLSDRPKGADGVGLGLTISRTLSRMAGGDVTVESTPGEGATFIVTMPRVNR